jgi:hypothetical protein
MVLLQINTVKYDVDREITPLTWVEILRNTKKSGKNLFSNFHSINEI